LSNVLLRYEYCTNKTFMIRLFVQKSVKWSYVLQLQRFFSRALQQRNGNFRGLRALLEILHVRVLKPSCDSYNGNPTKILTVALNMTKSDDSLTFFIDFFFQRCRASRMHRMLLLKVPIFLKLQRVTCTSSFALPFIATLFILRPIRNKNGILEIPLMSSAVAIFHGMPIEYDLWCLKFCRIAKRNH
jgi:hypothetical protein